MNLGKIIVYISSTILITSCAIPNYNHRYKSPKGLDLRTGKWLVSYVEGNLTTDESKMLAKEVFREFKEIGVDSIQLIDNVRFDYILPDRFRFLVSTQTLDLLHKTTDFNYMIGVKAVRIKDELASIMIDPPYKESENKSKVEIVVHDIDDREKIYHQTITGTVTLDEEDDEVIFTKSTKGLIEGALKRGLKQIKKYAAY
mgnify:CR=1 FL=1